MPFFITSNASLCYISKMWNQQRRSLKRHAKNFQRVEVICGIDFGWMNLIHGNLTILKISKERLWTTDVIKKEKEMFCLHLRNISQSFYNLAKRKVMYENNIKYFNGFLLTFYEIRNINCFFQIIACQNKLWWSRFVATMIQHQELHKSLYFPRGEISLMVV